MSFGSTNILLFVFPPIYDSMFQLFFVYFHCQLNETICLCYVGDESISNLTRCYTFGWFISSVYIIILCSCDFLAMSLLLLLFSFFALFW